MKGLAITDKGLEDVSRLEIEELIGVKGKVKDSVVIFDYKKKEELEKLCYRGQSVFKVLKLIDNFSVKDNLIKEVEDKIKAIDFKKYLKKGQKFAVRCWYKKAEISRGDVERAAGSLIPGKVDLSDPDVLFFIFIYGSEIYFGIDFSRRDLGEREYKIFSHPHSLKGPVAYGLVRLSSYTGKEIFLNCFCKSGEIAIEAALFGSGFSVNHYSKNKFDFESTKFDKTRKKKLKIYCIDGDFRSLSATKKNAKIAGVNDLVMVSRNAVEDFDIKFKEKEVDLLVAQVMKSDEINRMKEFFYQADFILKDKMVLLCREQDNFDELAKVYKFKKVEERLIERGGTRYKVLIYTR